MKSNLVVIALASLTVAFTACGSRNPADPSAKAPAQTPAQAPTTKPDVQNPASPDQPATLEVIGTWHSPSTDQDGLKMEQLMTINDGSVTVKSSCSYKGKTAEAEATAKAVVDAASIDLQEGLEKPAVIDAGDGGTVDCGIHIEKMKIDYEIKEGKLFFKKDGQSTLVGDRKI